MHAPSECVFGMSGDGATRGSPSSFFFFANPWPWFPWFLTTRPHWRSSGSGAVRGVWRHGPPTFFFVVFFCFDILPMFCLKTKAAEGVGLTRAFSHGGFFTLSNNPVPAGKRKRKKEQGRRKRNVKMSVSWGSLSPC